MKRLLMPTNSTMGMTRSEYVRLAKKREVAPAPWSSLQQALAIVLVSLPHSESSDLGGRAVAGSWRKEAVCAACRPWLTTFPQLMLIEVFLSWWRPRHAQPACRPLGALRPGLPRRQQ